MLANGVENDVVRLAVVGEIFLRLVDHPVRSKGSDELEVLRTAHRGYLGAEVPGQLHPCGADSPGRAVDEDRAPFPEICLFQTHERIECAVENRRSSGPW